MRTSMPALLPQPISRPRMAAATVTMRMGMMRVRRNASSASVARTEGRVQCEGGGVAGVDEEDGGGDFCGEWVSDVHVQCCVSYCKL